MGHRSHGSPGDTNCSPQPCPIAVVCQLHQHRACLRPVHPSLPCWELLSRAQTPEGAQDSAGHRALGWSWGSQDDPGWSRLAGCPPGPPGLSWLPPPHVLVLGSVPPRQGPACPLSASVRFCHPRSLGGPGSCGPSGPSQGLRVGCRVGSRVKGEKVTEAHLAPSWRARSRVTSVSPSPWSLWPIRPGCCPPRRPSSGLGKDQETPMFHEGHTTTQNHPHGFRAPGEEEEELCGH